MKLPLEERVLQARSFVADAILHHTWPCEYWSRDEQMFACAEGWCLTVFGDQERIERWFPERDHSHHLDAIFGSNEEALAYVAKRAEEGSPLHCRALVLHIADVLKNGQ